MSLARYIKINPPPPSPLSQANSTKGARKVPAPKMRLGVWGSHHVCIGLVGFIPLQAPCQTVSPTAEQPETKTQLVNAEKKPTALNKRTYTSSPRLSFIRKQSEVPQLLNTHITKAEFWHFVRNYLSHFNISNPELTHPNLAQFSGPICTGLANQVQLP